MIYTPLTKKALVISFEAHKNQKDKSGMPYVFHPFHLAEQMDTENAVCVALLHDVVEDTDITLEDLRKEGFPYEVICALSLLTHHGGVPYMDYIRSIRDNPLAKQVKLADLAHNSDLTRLDSVDEAARRRVENYQEAIRYLTAAPDPLKDRIRGCLIGGAAGDALGYPVEFISEREIFNRYGAGGIQAYELNRSSRQAIISDDTQMTLFSLAAVGIYLSRGNHRGIAANPRYYANLTYQGWLKTQEMSYEEAREVDKFDPIHASVILMDQPELFARRAPGITCLSALHTRRQQLEDKKLVDSFVKDIINHSKGCGGVMRVAPVGMLNTNDMDQLDREGAEFAAITHCHSLGYMPAAVLTHIVHRCLYRKQRTLREIVEEARDTVAKLYADDEHIGTLVSLIDLAITLSENDAPDLDNIHKLGEGWVAEEALVIAVYCCLRYPDDFSKCLIASVNHKGDSDSTGAIAGNILGAWLGYEALENKWKENLELSDTILRLADAMRDELPFGGYGEPVAD